MMNTKILALLAIVALANADDKGGGESSCTECSAKCCSFCMEDSDAPGTCPNSCVFNSDTIADPASCLQPTDDKECTACAEEVEACFANTDCNAMVFEFAMENLQNPLYAAMASCTQENCPGDNKEDEDDCPICGAAQMECAKDVDCRVIIGKLSSGGTPSFADFENPKMQAIMTCHMENCPDTMGDDKEDEDDCLYCGAVQLECYMDKDCGVIIEKLTSGGTPSFADYENPKMQAIMTCHNQYCPDTMGASGGSGGSGSDDEGVMACLDANCKATLATCMGGACADEFTKASEGDEEPSAKFVAAASADFKAVHTCYVKECRPDDDDDYDYGDDDDDYSYGDYDDDDKTDFDLKAEVKKLLVDLGVTPSAADTLITGLDLIGQALEEAVMPAGATAPDMTKLFDNTVFTDAVTGAGVDLDEAKAAAASFEYDGGNNGDDSASAISAAAAVVAASIVAALL